jgi:hypothetical protein
MRSAADTDYKGRPYPTRGTFYHTTLTSLGVALAVAACIHRPPPLSLDGPMDAPTVEALIEAAARARGLPLKGAVAWRIVPHEELEAAMAEAEAHAEERDIEAERGLDVLLEATALVSRTWTPASERKALVRDQLFGWYDPLRKVMHVLDRPVAEMVPGLDVASGLALRAAVVHEAAHAVQDQNFGLAALLDRAPTVDALVAARGLTEGDASLVMMDAVRDLVGGAADPVPGERAVRESYAAGAVAISHSLRGLSPFGREVMLFAYTDGAVFAAALRRVGGARLLDEAFRRPPLSTAQVLHPELYVQGVRPDEIGDLRSEALAQAGYQPSLTGSFGELGCNAYLGEGLRDAALGWRGDRYFVLRGKGGGLALVWVTTWATEANAEAFASAAWERGRAGCNAEERCDAGVPVWAEARGAVAVVVRGLAPDLEDAAVEDAFRVEWKRPEPAPLPGLEWKDEPAGEPYADLATRARLMPGRVLPDRLAFPAFGLEVPLPAGAWKFHEGQIATFSQAFTAPNGGMVAVALLPSGEAMSLGAFAEGVARGATAQGNLRLARSATHVVAGRPAVEKHLLPTGQGSTGHVLAFARNGWVLTLVGVPPQGTRRAQVEEFRRAIVAPRILPLEDALKEEGPRQVTERTP